VLATAAPVLAPSGAPGRSVSAVTCSTTAEEFEEDLKDDGVVDVSCPSSCRNGIDQADAGWAVWGTGPFRIDSAICRAALVAGVIGNDGGEATLVGTPPAPDFIPFGTKMRGTFCFEGMKRSCTYDAEVSPPDT